MIKNLTRNHTVAESPRLASSFWIRASGMIGKTFDSFDALIIPGCSSIHTWFMGYSLDLIFLDTGKKVLRLAQNISPWRMVVGPRGTSSVIELPAGKLCVIPMELNDQLAW